MIKALATKNVAAVLLTLGMVLGFAFVFATPAKADTLSDLQAQVQALLAQISSLQGSSSTSSSSAACFTFTMNHKVGASGGEVMWVQKFLNGHGFTVASSGAGSAGNETSHFGPATKAAVKKFQEAYASDILTPVGLSKGTGNWGASTRAKANALCVSTTGPTTGPVTGPSTVPETTVPATGGAVSVGVASQPANSLAPQGAIRVPFTTFTLTNNSSAAVTINGVMVRRTGLGQDAAFAGIVLVDQNGIQVGISKTLNSNHETTVGDTWTIQPGQTQTLTVAGNMNSSLSSYSGQVVSLSVTGITTSATVSGSLPITGASQTLNSTLAIGSVTAAISSFDPNSAQSKNIGDTGIKFTGVRFTAGSAEDLKLFSIRWRLNGSVSPSDMANVTTVVNGTTYPTAISADGRYYTTTFSAGLPIQKGFSLDAYIQGDIVGSNASSRVAQFDIDKQSDVYFVGQLYGYGIQMPYNNNTSTASTLAAHATTYTSSGNPVFQGSTFSITGASATAVAKATEVAAQNVALNVPNQPLGGYIVDLKGEQVSVQSQVFTIATSSTGTGYITNATIVDENGAVVAGPVDASGLGTSLTFTDTVTYKTGRHVYTIKGKYPSTFTNGGTVTLSFTPSTAWTNSTGQITGNSFTWPASAVTMNAMTIRAASLAVAVSATPSAQNIVAGQQGVLFANYQFDASQSGEDVRLSSLGLTASTSVALFSTTDVTSCQLWDGATALNTGSNVVNPTITIAAFTATAVTFTLDSSFTVPKGTVKTLALKCNVSASALGSLKWGITSTQIGAISATGVTSSVAVTPTGSTNNGQLMTIATGSLVVSTDSSSPSYAVVAAGSTGVTLGAYKFRPTNDAVNLTRVGLKLTNTASSSASDLMTVHLFQGTTEVGMATFVGASTNATSTLTTPLLLAKDMDTVITVKADLAAQGTSQAGTPGHLVAVDIDTNGTNTQATGVGSGSTINASGSTAVSGVRIFKSYPVFTYDTTGATANTGVNNLLVLTVTAPASGPIKMNKLTFTIATTTATLASPTFAGPSGNVSSSTNATINALGTAVTVWFDSISNTADQEVAANATKTYTLRGTVTLTGTNTTGAVSTALKADTAYPSLSGFMSDAVTLAGSNLVWSPESTTSPAAAGNDWINGYGLGGCFTTSGLGNDCTARVISK